MRVLFIGFGNVGRRMARILTVERSKFPGMKPLDDLVTVKWLTSGLEDINDDIADSALCVAPCIEGVDAAANKDETLVFNKFIMDRLGGDVFTLERAVFDCVGNV